MSSLVNTIQVYREAGNVLERLSTELLFNVVSCKGYKTFIPI
ncbi:MAG: hypothetical protein AAFO04_08110 [Cyanobacteria bacterium J06592_8]